MGLKKIFSLAGKVIKVKLFNGRLPVKVTFHITYRCNLGCVYCGRSNLDTPEMNTGQIKGMMHEFKEMGTSSWIFNGGEPLLRDDLPELIDYAKELDFHCGLVTNGVLLPEKIVKESAFKKLDFVQISLEGPKEIHERMCGAGTHDKIIEALGLLKTFGIRTNILTLLTKDNIECFDYLLELVVKYRMSIAFQPLALEVGQGLNSIEEQHFPQRDKFSSAVERLIQEKRKGAPILSSFKYLNMIKDYWPDTAHKIRCYSGRLFCNITPDGYVVPCCAKLSRTEAKNSGLQAGFKKAFKELGGLSGCHDCYYFGPQEANITMTMSVLDIYRIYKDILKRR